MIKIFRAAALAIGFIGVASAPASAGVILNGVILNGVILNGVILNGVILNGVILNGASTEGHGFEFAPAGLVLPNGTAVTLQ